MINKFFKIFKYLSFFLILFSFSTLRINKNNIDVAPIDYSKTNNSKFPTIDVVDIENFSNGKVKINFKMDNLPPKDNYYDSSGLPENTPFKVHDRNKGQNSTEDVIDIDWQNTWNDEEDWFETGSFYLLNIEENKIYPKGAFYFETIYCDSNKNQYSHNADGKDESLNIKEFTALPELPIKEPKINSLSVKDISLNKAAIEYDITIPTDDSNYADTYINEIEVTDGKKVYGFINNNKSVVSEKGNIELNDLETSTNYDNLYINITYNDNHHYNSDNSVEDGKVPEFTTLAEDHFPSVIMWVIISFLILISILTIAFIASFLYYRHLRKSMELKI